MSHLATTAIGAFLPYRADHERQHGIDLARSPSRRQITALCARRTAGAVMSDFSPRGLKKVPVRHEPGGAMAAMSDRLGSHGVQALQPLDGQPRNDAPPPGGSACPSPPSITAHSRGHLYVTSCTEGFSHFVTSMTAPVASGWSGCRVGLAPTGKRRRTHRAHVERTSRIAAVAAGGKRSTALNAIERLPHAAQSRPSDRQAQRSAEVVDELFSHWQARNSVWAVVPQWNPRG